MTRHEGEELLADVFDSLHIPWLNEVLKAPGRAEAGGFPAVVNVEQSDVVTRRIVEFGLFLVRLLLLLAWAVEDVLRGGYHGNNSKYFIRALHRDTSDKRLGE